MGGRQGAIKCFLHLHYHHFDHTSITNEFRHLTRIPVFHFYSVPLCSSLICVLKLCFPTFRFRACAAADGVGWNVAQRLVFK